MTAVFDVATFAEDFAGPGRTAEASTEDTAYYVRHRGTIELDNGWSFSCIWGYGSYTSNYRIGKFSTNDRPPARSIDAEIMPGGPTWTPAVNCDTVAGYVTAPQMQAALVAAERDDQYGVIYHLSELGRRS